AIRDVDIDRIAFLQTEETAARLNSAVQIRGREREAWEAERVRSVGLLSGDDAAPWPLVTAVAARERNRTHDPVSVDHRCPHIQVEPAVRGSTRRRKLRLQRCLIRQVRTGPLRVSDVPRRQHTYQGQSRHKEFSRHSSPPRFGRLAPKPDANYSGAQALSNKIGATLMFSGAITFLLVRGSSSASSSA